MKVTAVEIVQKLQNAGHQAYFAGGCVRDILLNIQPNDFDIVTSANPDQIENLFEKTIPIGKKFGIILVIQNGHHYEIATFRKESGYSDNRRPDYVDFTDAPNDAKRRDFTINGIFYDPVNDQIFDYVDGVKDLEQKLVRFIGDPHQRIEEDHLRLIRAVRFKNTLDFQYDPETYQAVKKYSQLIVEKVSLERLRDEFNKMILDQTRPSSSFEDLSHLGILEKLIPELEAMRGVAQPAEYHEEGDVWTHSMQALDSLPAESNLTVRWATLLHDVGKPETYRSLERIRFDSHATKSSEIARKILKRLRFPSKQINDICWCIEHHMMMVPLVEMNAGRKMHWFLNPQFKNLMSVMEADALGTKPSDLSLFQKIKNIYAKLTKRIKEIPQPLLNGHEIMEELGLAPSPELSRLKAELVELQMEGKIKTKRQALDWLRKQQK